MANFRLHALANLARQLAFTPHDTRAAQLNAAELLLHQLNPQKAYPIDFVVFRITGYQPKTDGNSDLLTGLALQHDLGLLIEEVSDSLKLHSSTCNEPVLAIDDVTQRFSVTSKTIQRWRRRGLPARRFTFPDGKRRVGFFLSSVERFIAGHQNQLGSSTVCGAVEDVEQSDIIRHARRLAVNCRCCVDEICLRIGKRFHRTPMTVLHTLRKHDADHPDQAILSRAADSLTDEQVARIIRGRKAGLQIRSLSQKIRRPRAMIYRAVVQDRVARLNKRKIRFIDDTMYHDEGAEHAIHEIVSQQELAAELLSTDLRIPRDLPPYLRELYRTPLLSPARERALFLEFNFRKFQFVAARRKLEPDFAGVRDLNLLERYLAKIYESKNQILQANLRLVVSVARRHVRPGVCLMELISEGNLILMRAVEGFDIHKGYRFSTYATLALMKGFAQAVPTMLATQRNSLDSDMMSNMADLRGTHAIDQRLDRDHVQHLLNRLDEREKLVLRAHYGLGSDTGKTIVPSTFAQLGEQLGLTKQRVRQIEQSALAKLRN